MSENSTSAPSTTTAAPAEASKEPSQQHIAAEQRPGETKAEAARRIRIQWEGREEEVDDKTLVDTLLSALGEDGVRNVAQLGKVARTKVAKLGEQERALRAAAEDLKDPRRLFALVERMHGRKAAREYVEDWYAAQLEEDRLAPEEKERRSLSQELEKLRAEKQKLEQERYQRELSTKTQEAQRQIGSAFKSALSEVGLDPTPHMMARMAALAEAQLSEGVPFDARELAREVAAEYEQGEVAGFLKKLASNPEKLVKYLGQDGLRNLRQWDVERVKATAPKGNPLAPQQTKKARQETNEKVSIDDFFAKLKKK